MINLLIYLMIYSGSALMACNIYRYMLFSRHIRQRGDWTREHRLFRIPVVLLILFLAGYLSIGLFGEPDLIIAGILFGGSIFVFLMLVLIQRVTDRIQEHEHLKAELEAAEQASRAKTFFLSNMSHDIRTPLNAIIGYANLASREGVSYEEQTQYVRKITGASRQLLDLVNDVLEMSRIESGRMQLNPIPVNLETCFEEAGDLVKNQLEEKHIHFTISKNTSHKWVLCDQVLLNRVLMNLLCNAGKFTPEAGRVSLILKEFDANEENGDYEIRVEDTGIGMSQDFVKHIFSPFEREKTSTISKTQGTGLGMAITKNIIDLMGGTIEVETEKGHGTTFIIHLTFPLEEARDENTGNGSSGSSSGDYLDYHFEGTRILLVEDNPINTEIASMILNHSGFDVETAENGQEAVDKVSSSQAGYYDLVLMDIQMPVMDGYTATQKIRALEDPLLASIPILAMTANAFKDDMDAAAQAGMQGHIAKPLDTEKMMETISSVLDKKDNVL